MGPNCLLLFVRVYSNLWWQHMQDFHQTFRFVFVQKPSCMLLLLLMIVLSKAQIDSQYSFMFIAIHHVFSRSSVRCIQKEWKFITDSISERKHGTKNLIKNDVAIQILEIPIVVCPCRKRLDWNENPGSVQQKSHNLSWREGNVSRPSCAENTMIFYYSRAPSHKTLAPFSGGYHLFKSKYLQIFLMGHFNRLIRKKKKTPKNSWNSKAF